MAKDVLSLNDCITMELQSEIERIKDVLQNYEYEETYAIRANAIIEGITYAIKVIDRC